MRILATNDDGIESEGLRVLARELTALGQVTVFAPSTNYSGAGAAIGHIGPGLPDIFESSRDKFARCDGAYHFDGAPALATMLACTGLFGWCPDVVVSGINLGWNVGHSVHFSGTIGACVTADVFDVPSIAISQPAASPDAPQRWSTAAEVAASLVPDVLETRQLLNVNVPNRPRAELGGVRYTTLADRLPYSLAAPTLIEIDSGRFAADFERFAAFESHAGSDTAAVESGHVSITPLRTMHAVS